jgi:hypothetical protein
MREARKGCEDVDMARGKGRLAREKEKEREDAARAHGLVWVRRNVAS